MSAGWCGVGGNVRGLGDLGAWDMGSAKWNMELDKWDIWNGTSVHGIGCV